MKNIHFQIKGNRQFYNTADATVEEVAVFFGGRVGEVAYRAGEVAVATDPVFFGRPRFFDCPSAP